jgi:hypothetical protein
VAIARTPENENLSRETYQDERSQQQRAYQSAQTNVGKFNKNIDTLDKGGEVAADPFLNAGYLANQNRVTSYETEGENASAKQALQDQNRRTGGQNTGATQATIADLARRKMRFNNQLQAQRSAQDYRSNLDYQQHMAEMPLQAAGAEGGLYGVATSGRNATGNNLTQYGLQQQDEWYKILNQGIQAAKAAASMGVGAATGGAGIAGFGEG